jgi:hypothetical protein
VPAAAALWVLAVVLVTRAVSTLASVVEASVVVVKTPVLAAAPASTLASATVSSLAAAAVSSLAAAAASTATTSAELVLAAVLVAASPVLVWEEALAAGAWAVASLELVSNTLHVVRQLIQVEFIFHFKPTCKEHFKRKTMEKKNNDFK